MPEPSPGKRNEEVKGPEETPALETPEAVTSAPETVAAEVLQESEADRAAAIEQARAEIEALTGGEARLEAQRTLEVPRAATFVEFAKLFSPERTAEIKQALTETYWGGLGDDAARLIGGEALPNLSPDYPGIDPATIHILDFFSQSGIDQADLEQTLGLSFI